jgi:subtilisin family serine protease
MSKFRGVIACVAMLALAAPLLSDAASAQTVPGREGGVRAPRGGGGHGWRGGGAIGLGLGLLGAAIAAGAAARSQGDGPPPRRVHPPRRPVIVEDEAPPPRRMHRPRRPVVVEEAPPPRRPRQVFRLAAPAARMLPPPAGEKRFAPDEILVQFRDGGDAKAPENFARRQKLQLVQSRQLSLIGKTIVRYRVADGRDLRAVLRRAARDNTVASVQPDYVYALQQEANTMQPPPEQPPAAPMSYVGGALNLPLAHAIATGKGVRVAVIDSSVDLDHPELAGAVAESFDALPIDRAGPHAHGTGMAGAIAGRKKLDGAAPQAQILAARSFGDKGDAARAVTLDIASGLDWAAGKGARVVNMSFAGPADPLLAEMIAAAAKKKMILIAAAGNEGPNAPPQYPAAYPQTIAVSAVNDRAELYDRANRGDYVAFAAPGVEVLAAAPKGAYDFSTGTSIACAEVSGIAALLLEKRPDLDGEAMRALLRRTARKLTADAGAGEVDALAALKSEE